MKQFYQKKFLLFSMTKLVLSLMIFMLATTFIYAQPSNGPGGPERETKINGRTIKHKPRIKLDTNTCLVDTLINFRSIDGTCNNIRRGNTMEFGATDILFRRDIAPVYGSENLLGAMGGEDRRGARDVSNIVADQPSIIFSETGLSALVYNWGQFIDHDFALTPENEEDEENIPIPDDDPLFTDSIHFVRAEYITDIDNGEPREQLNALTAWIDASMVYGSDEDRASWLRSFSDGKLKVSTGNLLPFNTLDGEYDSELDTLAPSMAGADENGKMWVAGDVRAGEQVGLTSLHTIFVREHNRICDELVAEGMNDDEDIYQEAKKMVNGIIQKITYTDFLPAMGVDIDEYTEYNEFIDPSITNIFTTAGWRIGHTMVVDSVRMFDNDCQPAGDTIVSLIKAFFNPDIIREFDIDYFLRGLAIETQYEIDPYIVDELRDFLFSSPNAPIVAGLDLAAANIQRGRDHGLPDYNSIREYFTGSAAIEFEEISSNATIMASLIEAYNGDIDNIDAWVGLICEDRVDGASFGVTMLEMLEEKFGNLRDGDRFWYQRYLSADQITEIENTTFKDVIERNTGLSDLQDDVFFSDASCLTTSVNDFSSIANDFVISPNPVSSGFLDITVSSGDLEIMSAKVINSNGTIVYNSNVLEKRISLEGLPAGIYFFIVNTDNEKAAKKFIISK